MRRTFVWDEKLGKLIERRPKLLNVPTADRHERQRQESIVEGIPESRSYAENRIEKFKRDGYIPEGGRS